MTGTITLRRQSLPWKRRMVMCALPVSQIRKGQAPGLTNRGWCGSGEGCDRIESDALSRFLGGHGIPEPPVGIGHLMHLRRFSVSTTISTCQRGRKSTASTSAFGSTPRLRTTGRTSSPRIVSHVLSGSPTGPGSSAVKVDRLPITKHFGHSSDVRSDWSTLTERTEFDGYQIGKWARAQCQSYRHQTLSIDVACSWSRLQAGPGIHGMFNGADLQRRYRYTRSARVTLTHLMGARRTESALLRGFGSNERLGVRIASLPSRSPFLRRFQDGPGRQSHLDGRLALRRFVRSRRRTDTPESRGP